ncbi:metallophosphoesterase [Candidatus Woesearchaeota archaeon]|nr:metallophosphoesterase [Candidatus Woesearchaeota archaeon]
MMEREIIIMGDIELGGGTLTDDFISDKTLAKLIGSLTQKKHPVDLVLNGDTFDFLKCPYVDGTTRSYPRHITKEISLTKLQYIYKAHQKVFQVLKRFVRKRENRLFFTIGNHDHDLFFPAVQGKIKEYLGRKKNIFFRLFYHHKQVYAEHGQQYDFLNKIKPRQPFHTYEGKQILNIPWLSLGLISNFMYLKEEHPFLERIKPIPLMFSHHRLIVKKLSWRSVKYLLLSLLYFPIRHYYDPTYNFPKEMLKELYRRIKQVHWEVEAIVDKFKWRRRRLVRNNKILVLGHVHEKYIEEKNGIAIIHPSTWRDEYFLNEKTKILYPLPKRYVKIEVEEGGSLKWELVELHLREGKFQFEDVIKDEIAFIRKAAEQEKFKLSF